VIDRRNLPLASLRAFECAAKHKHVGKAGDELGVTYGAVSHRIRSLESKLNTKLFIRSRYELELTSSGKILYESVKNGLDIILEGTHNLNSNELTGDLVIGCTQTIASSWATKHFCEFQKKYPSVQLHIREIKPRQNEIPKEIDVAICYGKPNANSQQIQALAKPMLFPVCNPSIVRNKEVRNKKYHSLEHDFFDYTFLHDDLVSWDKWFNQHNLTPPKNLKHIYFPNTSQALTAAQQGYGVALCNTLEAQEFIRQGQLVRLSESEINEEEDYFLYRRVDKNASLKVSMFENWIKNIVNM